MAHRPVEETNHVFFYLFQRLTDEISGKTYRVNDNIFCPSIFFVPCLCAEILLLNTAHFCPLQRMSVRGANNLEKSDKDLTLFPMGYFGSHIPHGGGVKLPILCKITPDAPITPKN